MKRIRAAFEQHRARVAAHPFFHWLHSSETALRDRFMFTPLMVDFTMGFADMNKWFLGYEQPSGLLERSINQHTLEDRTHSRLFLENWHALGFDEKLAWPASQTLWWLYHSEETLPVRSFGWEILRLSVEYPDPLVRFALMESIEICGDVFFGNTSRVASQLSRQSGIDYRYYGEYHHLRETGHLHTDESPFFQAALTAEQCDQATAVSARIFSGFGRVLDHLLQYCRAHAASGSQQARELQQRCDTALQPRRDLIKNRALSALAEQALGRSQAPLLDYLNERKAQLARHPFLTWLSDSALEGTDKLRRFAALWAIDIAGYPDFLNHGVRYGHAVTPEQLALNRWAQQLSSHGIVYLQDWRALDLDRQLGWSCGETIAYYFLNEHTELHRRNLAKVTRYAFANPDPLQRFWLLAAFEAGGDPLFDALTSTLAGPEPPGAPLNYWAERHALAGEVASPPFGLLTREIDQRDQHCISETIRSLFDNFEQQFTLSFQQAQQETLLRQPGFLPPKLAPAPEHSPRCVVDQLSGK